MMNNFSYAAPPLSYPLISSMETGGLKAEVQWVDNDTLVFIGGEPGTSSEKMRWYKWILGGPLSPLKSIGNTDITVYGHVCAYDGKVYIGSPGVDSDGFIFRVVDRDGHVAIEQSKEKAQRGPGGSWRGFDCLSAYDESMRGVLWMPLLEKNRYLQTGERGKDQSSFKIIKADTSPYTAVDLNIPSDQAYPQGEIYLAFANSYFIRASLRRDRGYREIKPGQKCWIGWQFDAEGRIEELCVSIPKDVDSWFLSPVKDGYVVGSDTGLHFYSKPLIRNGQMQGDIAYEFRPYPGGIYAMEVSPDGCKIAAISTFGSGGSKRVARVVVENFCKG